MSTPSWGARTKQWGPSSRREASHAKMPADGAPHRVSTRCQASGVSQGRKNSKHCYWSEEAGHDAPNKCFKETICFVFLKESLRRGILSFLRVPYGWYLGLTLLFPEDGISSQKEMSRQWSPLLLQELTNHEGLPALGLFGGTRVPCEGVQEDIPVSDGRSAHVTSCLSNLLPANPVHNSMPTWKE